ncbi:hypothetical protein Bca52824_012583 [Brassica carinata]|uniref:Uncharacterized protein n=1 Tax=Brassica carinata TaxID=52824 RepID=A0A8X7VYH3_BRACI|nr:hypothetical protein Bca52824_012583 [Brassica carinata]
MRLIEEQDSKRTDLGVSSALSAAEKLDNVNIDEVELSLRETSSSLNYEEGSALLGRIEYQKGNIEAALRVFEGIDINGITIKMKTALTFRQEPKHRGRSKTSFAPPPPTSMSKHAVSLLFEAIFLKAKSLQRLEGSKVRLTTSHNHFLLILYLFAKQKSLFFFFAEAAQSCGVILDIVEASLSEADVKLKETLNKAVELLPQLWKLADSPRDAILSYRRALLNHWNLDPETTARIQKQYAVFLLYSGEEAVPPNLRSQSEGSFIPRNNVEEAILLLMLLLRKVSQKRITWDAAILDHLTFALTVAGDLTALAKQLEELSPEILDQRELYHTLSLCYHGAGEDLVALGLLRNLFSERRIQTGYLALESADMTDPRVLHRLALENAEERKLDSALAYAKHALKLGAESDLEVWLLLARILSAQKRFSDAESIVDAALDETGKWEQGKLLRLKAKLRVAKGEAKDAIETYTTSRTPSSSKQKLQLWKEDANGVYMSLEIKTHLALLSCSIPHSRYCLLLPNEIFETFKVLMLIAYSYILAGVLYKRQGQLEEAMEAFTTALDIDPMHVPSLISKAEILLELGNGSSIAVVRSFLMEALRIDRLNQSAWCNLGKMFKAEESVSSLQEAVECFQAAVTLEETMPVEPFR